MLEATDPLCWGQCDQFAAYPISPKLWASHQPAMVPLGIPWNQELLEARGLPWTCSLPPMSPKAITPPPPSCSLSPVAGTLRTPLFGSS